MVAWSTSNLVEAQNVETNTLFLPNQRAKLVDAIKYSPQHRPENSGKENRSCGEGLLCHLLIWEPKLAAIHSSCQQRLSGVLLGSCLTARCWADGQG